MNFHCLEKETLPSECHYLYARAMCTDEWTSQHIGQGLRSEH